MRLVQKKQSQASHAAAHPPSCAAGGLRARTSEPQQDALAVSGLAPFPDRSAASAPVPLETRRLQEQQKTLVQGVFMGLTGHLSNPSEHLRSLLAALGPK